MHDELDAFIAEMTKDPEVCATFEDAQCRHAVLDELVKRRRLAGLTQSHLAGRLKVRQPTISEFESEGSDPRLRTLQRYARAVGARIEIRIVDAEPE